MGRRPNTLYSALCEAAYLTSLEDPETERQLVEMAISRQADGVLITQCSFECADRSREQVKSLWPFVKHIYRLWDRYMRMIES